MLHHVTKGQGRPVLVLHGATLDHRHMVETIEPVFEGLMGWQRVYMDLPGHGNSPGSRSYQSMIDVLDAVIAFAVAIFPEQRLLLIGESRGSHIAQGVAHLRPDLIEGMMLIVPGGAPDCPPDRLPLPQVIRPAPELRASVPDDKLGRFDTWAVQSEAMLDKTTRTKWPATPLHDAAMHARMIEGFDYPFDLMQPVDPMTGPCLIVAGRQDPMSGFADAMDFLAIYPRASLAVLDTAAHAVAWERQDVFIALARDWLDRVDFEKTRV